MSNNIANSGNLIPSELWTSVIQEALKEQLAALTMVRDVSAEFGFGTQLTIPETGDVVTRTLADDETSLTYDAMDTGEINLTLDPEVYSANRITEKLLRHSPFANQMMANIPADQVHAIMEKYETDILLLANSQTASDANTINGFDHRYVATGTNETMTAADFAKAKISLKKAKVPVVRPMAIVDPTVGYALETATNISNVSNNPRYEGILEDGLVTGFKFVRNIYGVDVFESNLLATANETIGGLTTASGKANIIFDGSNPANLPFVAAWRSQPVLRSEFDMDTLSHKIATTAEYGRLLARRENLVVVLSDDDQV